MKTTSKNKKAIRIFQDVFANQELSDKATEYRGMAGVPIRGFKTPSEREIWLKKVGKITPSIRHPLINLTKFKRCAVNKFPVLEEGCDELMEDLFYFGTTSQQTVDRVDATGCTLLPIIDSNKAQIVNGLKNGLYIKVGNHSTFEDIEAYVSKNRKLISSIQEVFYEKGKERVRPYRNFDRATLAYIFSKRSKDELMELGKRLDKTGVEYTNGLTKETLILRLLRVAGYKIADGNLRGVIARQKELREK